MRHLVTLFDISTDELQRIFQLSQQLKHELLVERGKFRFPGYTIALLFEKPSLRTRVSFETAITHLGGNSLYLGPDVGWGQRESTEDFARVLGSYVDAIICRAKTHDRVEALAKYAPCSVINGLTDLAHPCQALTDLYTLQEHRGSLAGSKLAFIGDANNVARSLAVACARTEVEFAIAAPAGYQFEEPFLREVGQRVPGFRWSQTQDPREAVADAACVYTDVWTSMGQESQRDQRRQAFAAYQVNERLMSAAPADCCFMHCLPAHRGEEVTDEVMDGPQSVVFQQAENRMHVQKGLLAWLLGEARSHGDTPPLPAK